MVECYEGIVEVHGEMLLKDIFACLTKRSLQDYHGIGSPF